MSCVPFQPLHEGRSASAIRSFSEKIEDGRVLVGILLGWNGMEMLAWDWNWNLFSSSVEGESFALSALSENGLNESAVELRL